MSIYEDKENTMINVIFVVGFAIAILVFRGCA